MSDNIKHNLAQPNILKEVHTKTVWQIGWSPDYKFDAHRFDRTDFVHIPEAKVKLYVIEEVETMQAELTRLREENAELVANISKAWRMGQEYWRLSDSESIANHKRAERLRIEFEALAKYKKDV